MYENNRHRKTKTIAVLAVCFVAISIFTALTLGIVKKSDNSIITSVAETSLQGNDKFVLLDSKFLESADGVSAIRSKLPGGSERKVCAIDTKLYDNLVNLDGVIAHQAHSYKYVVVGKNADPDAVARLMEGSKLACVTLPSKSFFFFYSPVQLS